MSQKAEFTTPQIQHAGRRAATTPGRKVYTILGYDRPTVWSGLGSVLDIGATFRRSPTIYGFQKIDRRAIASDWYAIGADLARSTKAFASRQSVKDGHGKFK